MTDVFFTARGDTGQAGSAELEQLIEEELRQGQATWPGIAVGAEAFVSYLGHRARGALPPETALRGLRATDLYLACACVQGDPGAIAAFETHHLSKTDGYLARLKATPVQIEEVKQSLRRRLLVPEREGSAPLIAQYSGRGPLQAWVRVAAIRAALKLLQVARRETPLEEEVLQALPTFAEDPELHYLKDTYRGAFTASLREAFRLLSPRTLNLLRYHYVDGLTTYEIAALYRVHQVTAARWLEKGRQEVLSETRRLLMQQLQVDQAECDSIMRLVQSHLDITLRSFFPA
jgi:RNA polymerase sigma-70 factor (ECF subfamily)